MIKSKKLIAIFVSAAMLMTMLASFTTVAYADEAAYTTHAWYTFEADTLPAGVTSNNSASSGGSDVDLTVDGKYGKGVKVSKRAGRESEKLYPELKVTLNDTIAIANGTTVEVEFDICHTIPEDYIYIFFADQTTDKYDTSGNSYIRIKPKGEVKVIHRGDKNNSSNINLASDSQYTITDYYRIKLVLEGSVNDETSEKAWLVKGAYFDGIQKNVDKWGDVFCTVDFKMLGFRTKMSGGKTGYFSVDNISITSYPTPSNGISPVPDRHKFMNKVLAYTDKVGTAAYNSALALYEKDYLTADDISDALYGLEGNSSLFDITDIGKANSSVKYITTDTTGGKPLLVVGAYDRDTDKLYAVQFIKLSGFKNDGETENRVTYDLGELPEEDIVIKTFIFSSLDKLAPLASPYAE